jgi:hypothetical protein
VDASCGILLAHNNCSAATYEVAEDFFADASWRGWKMESPNSLESTGRNRAGRRRAWLCESGKGPDKPRGDKDREDKPGSPRPKGPDMPDWMRSLIRSLKDEAGRKKKDSD